MGEITESILTGTHCSVCGVPIEVFPMGFPRQCLDCEESELKEI